MIIYLFLQQSYSSWSFPKEPSYRWQALLFVYLGVIWSSKATVCKRHIRCITIGVKFLCAGLFIFQSAALSWDFWGKLVALGSFEASQVEGFVSRRFTSSDLFFNRFISLLLHMYSSEGENLLLVKYRAYFPCGIHRKKKNCVKNCCPGSPQILKVLKSWNLA